LEHGTTEERKTLIQAFLQRSEIYSREPKGAAYFGQLPVGIGTLSFGMVAGPDMKQYRRNWSPRRGSS
jgi:hypothetical protein